MKTKTKITSWVLLSVVAFTLSIFTFTGCQKVINVDLVEAAPRLVIEGLITDSVGPYRVRLSKSGSYFNQPVLPPVSKAVVVISDNVGTIDTLKEKIPGSYFTSKIQGKPGRTYTLEVVSENNRYTGTSTMFSHVEIDSLKLGKDQSQRFGFGGNGQNEKRVEVHCIFTDPHEKNFYRIKVITNDTLNVENYRLYDDEYTNGKKTDLQVKRVKVGDICQIELISLDKYAYNYYRTLRDLIHSNPIFGSTPANPNTNLTNGALGYFGAYAISARTITITDSLFNSAK